MTHCITKSTSCTPLPKKKLEVNFKAGTVSSFGGVYLLRETEKKLNLFHRISKILSDKRDRKHIQHPVKEMIAQRITALSMGCEDLNDHAELRNEPMLKMMAGEDLEKSLASPSTLCRWEKSVTRDQLLKMNCLLIDLFVESLPKNPPQLILDFDTTDFQLYGNQEGRYFNGYYDEYCFTPLYVMCGDRLLFAYLHECCFGASYNVRAILKLIVEKIRAKYPNADIVFRGDSAFGTNEILSWCEKNKVHYITGFNCSNKLDSLVKIERNYAYWKYSFGCPDSRIYTDFQHQGTHWFNYQYDPVTHKRHRNYVRRRVICKAEYTPLGANTRFIVTDLSGDNRTLYEKVYCASGDMENRIKENKGYLFSSRTSSSYFCANQYRLLLSSFAYVLMNEFRHDGLHDTELAKAQCNTIREKIIKTGAIVYNSVRRVLVSFSKHSPFQNLFTSILTNLQQTCLGSAPQIVQLE